MSELIELSEESIKRIAAEVNKLNQKDFDKRRKSFKSNALHNTKKLLENYKKIKVNCAAVEEQYESFHNTFWNNGRLSIDALMANKAKSVKMLRHVDIVLDKYEEMCKERHSYSKSRRYSVVTSIYMYDVTIDNLALRYDVDRTTILRNRDEAIEELSIMLFGVDIFNEI